MNDISRLIAIEDIKQLKARYFRGIDMKDESLLRSCFTQDVTCDFRGAVTDPQTGFNPLPGSTENQFEGLEQAVATFMEAGTHFTSVHHGHMPEIEIRDETNARGIWAMFDTLQFPQGPVERIDAYGHYHETYRKVGSAWKIRTLKLTRLRVNAVMR